MDFDEILDLEEQFYREGFEEGRHENLTHNYLEGKQYGLQVGFQRYILLGLIEGICHVVKSQKISPAAYKNACLILDMVSEISLGNDEISVQAYEGNIVKVRNKFRLLLLALSRRVKERDQQSSHDLSFQAVEKMSKLVAGELSGYVDDEAAEVPSQSQSEIW
ncbi:LAQU0S15e02344g1_1 [Lachancea quebecensis]|uniref:LAQU0S15e02344g1_1 n=1 Tax=Lachancea quebecensis TaxID=1654605 RepID=A0A0P1KW77_9SACH|nr:LAQU0S15e02344g1_1 [Lachancea quebecensis]